MINGNGTDEHGFGALPGGYRLSSGDFSNVGSYGNWWSATGGDATYARERNVNYDYALVSGSWLSKTYALSVRCLRDD